MARKEARQGGSGFPLDAVAATGVAVERLRAGRPTVLRATGASMAPFLVEGDRVLVAPCPWRRLRPGDLVAFVREGRPVLHRVLAVDRALCRVLEKGDGAATRGELAGAHVLGRAVAIVDSKLSPLGRWPYAWMAPALALLSRLHGRAHRTMAGRGAEPGRGAAAHLALERIDRVFRGVVAVARSAALLAGLRRGAAPRRTARG